MTARIVTTAALAALYLVAQFAVLHLLASALQTGPVWRP